MTHDSASGHDKTGRRRVVLALGQAAAAVRRAFHFRVWYGLGAGVWFAMLVEEGARIPLRYWPRVIVFSWISVFNSLVGYLSRLVFARRVRAVDLGDGPVFVLGHWRCGTSYLHEIMACDERFMYPRGDQCFVPHLFLACETSLRGVLDFFVPGRRPMDAMKVRLDRPQEDEFAMLGLLGRSTYRAFVFPSSGPRDRAYLSLRGLQPRELERWIDTWLYFLKSVAVRHPPGRRLLLKSPQHTARVAAILRVFPNAKFVHIARNPLELYASTSHMLHRMCDEQGLEGAGRAVDWVESYVFEAHREMYNCYQQDKQAIPSGNLAETSYEALVQDPENVLRQIYQRLDLGPLRVNAALAERLSESRQYRANQHRLDAAQIGRIAEEWAGYIETYGYAGLVGDALARARMRDGPGPGAEFPERGGRPAASADIRRDAR